MAIMSQPIMAAGITQGCTSVLAEPTDGVVGSHIHASHNISTDKNTAIHGAAGCHAGDSVRRNHSQSAQPAMTSSKPINGNGLVAAKAPKRTNNRTTAVST